jgi:hypothetical protein
MAIDSNGKNYENRTLQFYGCAYGTSNVSLNATINDLVVFSGEIPTVDSQISNNDTLLFSVENAAFIPTNWEGSFPMSITVTGGDGVTFTDINSNYMPIITSIEKIVMENSSIEGDVLTVGTVTSGTVTAHIPLSGTGVLANTFIQSGSGSTWSVVTRPLPIVSQLVPSTTITGTKVNALPGNATTYSQCYISTPTNTNSENTPDPRSSVKIDGVAQVPPLPPSQGIWAWHVPTGSTISYNLNVSLGNCAQS